MSKFFDAGVPAPWPHGSYDEKADKVFCPDDVSCAHANKWGRPCSRDIGGGYECERLPPPGGWDEPDLDWPEGSA